VGSTDALRDDFNRVRCAVGGGGCLAWSVTGPPIEARTARSSGEDFLRSRPFIG
jgi:hypothetical protein